MPPTSSHHSKGFSLGTKLILFTVMIETVTIVFSVYLMYQFLSEQRVTQYRQVLLSESVLIAKEVELAKSPPFNQLGKLEINSAATFQILDNEGRVLWDNKNPKRMDTLILNHHALYSLAKKSTEESGIADYSSSQTQEKFLGTFRKVSHQFLVLGAISKDEIEYEINRTIERFLYLALLLYGISLLAVVFFTRRVVNPIRALTAAARQIADGNFELVLEKPSNDEIGTLSESFTLMTQRVRALLEGEAQKFRMETEVGGVAELQNRLLPKSDIENPRYEIRSFYQSATETGGDYWGFLETDHQLLVYVGDATGHGLPSAMLTAAARGCFSALQKFYRQSPKELLTPGGFLNYANQAVCDVSQGDLQMTMFVAVFSYADRKLSFSNAGHNPAWIIRNENQVRRIETLLSKGARLGESNDYVPNAAQEVDFGEEDTLFLYSDGLIDMRNDAGLELGKSKIRALLLSEGLSGASLSQTREKLLTMIRDFNRGAIPEDDITFSLLRFRK